MVEPNGIVAPMPIVGMPMPIVGIVVIGMAIGCIIGCCIIGCIGIAVGTCKVASLNPKTLEP